MPLKNPSKCFCSSFLLSWNPKQPIVGKKPNSLFNLPIPPSIHHLDYIQSMDINTWSSFPIPDKMGIADILDDINKAPRFRPLVDKVVEPPPPQVPENRPRLNRVPMPGSAARATHDMATSRLQSRGAPGAESSLNSDKHAVASSRNNSGSPTQPRAGNGPTRTPRTTGARADPLAKPNQNPG